uniref:Uncharacterized protein n=1 Tax=Tanacetum cinerariifolium TaxID=118510 RepID=A0A699GVY4_TANCI|nr:hypothetical protein [Tanacetum cinerariifolium]
MDDPNITMEEYIRRSRPQSVETEFPAIIFNDNLTSNETLSCEPTVSSLNDNEIDFRISFDESEDEDCTVVFDKNSFSYKIIYANYLKTDSENDNEKVNMPLFSSTEPSVSCIDDLDFFKDFENGFPAIVYNDAPTSKSDFSTEPTLCPQHIDEFSLKNETSLSEYRDNDDDKIDIKQPSGDMSVIQLPNMINVDTQGNYGVTCEDEAKRRNYGTKMKTFEETVICYYTPYTAKRIRRISASSSQEYA